MVTSLTARYSQQTGVQATHFFWTNFWTKNAWLSVDFRGRWRNKKRSESYDFAPLINDLQTSLDFSGTLQIEILERETSLELATSTLARLRSTN